MRIIHQRCCALDVHKLFVACITLGDCSTCRSGKANLDAGIVRLKAEIREKLASRQDLANRPARVPGVGEITAWAILAEIGFDTACSAFTH